MAQLAPPPAPPRVTTSDYDGLRRFRLRMLQVVATMATLGVTCWLCTLGALPGVIAVVAAKHVLVAIIMMGLGIDSPPAD
jgi:hypothetical protein